MFCLTRLPVNKFNLFKSGFNLLVKPTYSQLVKTNVFYFASNSINYLQLKLSIYLFWLTRSIRVQFNNSLKVIF